MSHPLSQTPRHRKILSIPPDEKCGGRRLLAPHIVEAIVRGDESSGLSLEKLTKKLPMLWDEQRQRFRLAEH